MTTPWGELGNKLTPDGTLDKWANEAGLDFEIGAAPVTFAPEDGDGQLITYTDRKALYRKDNYFPLSVVSPSYNIHQPMQVLEVYRNFVEAGDMRMDYAGITHGGQRIWALAKVNADFTIGEGDLIEPYLLMIGSADGKLSTTGILTTIRAWCTNMFHLAFKEGSAKVRIPHTRDFDEEEVRRELTEVREAIPVHAEKIQKLAEEKVSDKIAVAFFLEILKTKKEIRTGEVNIKKKKRGMNKLWASYKQAPGHEDTAWGLLNAVTHSWDYNPTARSIDARLTATWLGEGARLKGVAYDLLSDGDFLEILRSENHANISLAEDYISQAA